MQSTADVHVAVERDRPTARGVAGSLWLPAIAATVAYPFSVDFLVDSYHAAKVHGSIWGAVWALCATVALALVCAAPGLALRGLYAIRLVTTQHAIAVRRLLHLAVAVPPLYLLSGRVAGLLSPWIGRGASGLIVWWGIWLALTVLVWNAGRRPAGGNDSLHGSVALSSVRVRNIHRVAVIAIVVAFLVMHLANHVVAVWSVSWQRATMLALRSWYRAVWMEPVILGLFAAAALSGVLRLARLTRSASDGFRVLQTASAAYLACFLVSHLWATLGARYHGIDPDWNFATAGTGKAGMLANAGSAAVFIYYAFVLLAVAVHAGLGLRMLLLSRHVQAAVANRAARLTALAASVVSMLIVAALIGVRLGG